MQTREITKLIGLCDNAKQLIIKPKKVNITLPLTLAPKSSGMGITVERMAETTTPYATRIIEATHTPRVPFQNQTNFLSQYKLSSAEIEQLIQFQKTNPKHFDEICESGLFDLIKSGKIDSKILKNLRKNMTLTPNILKDIKKIHTGQPLVTEIPAATGLENIGKFVEEGEVGVLNGTLYANQGGKPVRLDLSKEKFEELFPLLERFRMEQGFLGDCWLISAIDNMMSNATQRVNLYKLLSQDGNDILIRYPSGKNALRFVNGEISSNDKFMESGAKGLKMFEQSFVFHRANKYTKGAESTDVLARLKENPNLVYKLDGGVEGFFTDAVIGNDNVKSLKTWKDFFITQFYRPIKFRLKTLGQDHSTHAKLSRWKQEKSSDIVIYTCEKGEMNGYREGLVNWDFDLHAPHAYAVKDYAGSDRLVTLSNPHHTEVNITAPLNILEDYGTITRFNSV